MPGGAIAALREARLVPYRFAGGRFHGGFREDEAPDTGRMRHKAGVRDVPAPAAAAAESAPGARLDGRYLYGGPLWAHYGHVLVDCVHRLWALHEDGGAAWDGIVFTGVIGLRGVRDAADLGAARPPDYLGALIRLLGLPDLPVHLVRAPTTVARLDVPEQGTWGHGPILPFYRAHLDRYQRHLQDSLADRIAAAPERVYLGRSHLIHKGGVVGGSYFRDAMARDGVAPVEPETLDLGEQLALFLGARILAADEGSALHTIQVLSRIGGRVAMLPRRAVHAVYDKAIRPRAAGFDVVTAGADIVALTDRFGTMSPGCLAAYARPEAAFEELRRLGLVSGGFDAGGFHAAERADLAAARATSPDILDGWTRAVAELRRG